MTVAPGRNAKGTIPRLCQAIDYASVTLSEPRLAIKAARALLHRNLRKYLPLIQPKSLSFAHRSQADLADRQAIITAIAAETGLLILRDAPNELHFGCSDFAYPRVLEWLLARGPMAQMFDPSGHLLDWTRADHRRKARSLPLVKLRLPHADGTGCSLIIQLEAYALREDGVWLSGNDSNTIARGIYTDIFSEPGFHHLRDLLPGPTLEQKGQNRPVDAVYTWVNHADPDWQRLIAAHMGRDHTQQMPEHRVPGPSDARSLARFHCNDELRYSLRSLAQNLPWLRHIYIVSNCAPPGWLRRHPQITWVDHAQIMPPEVLPTFSSHVIESFLHKIPGLAEHFLYLNDDVFIARPLPQERFFTPQGASLTFLESYAMVSGKASQDAPDYLNAARNSAALIHQAFGTAATRLHEHTVFALRKSLLAEIEARFPADFAAFRNNRFRSPEDLNLTSFLYHHYALNKGEAVTGHMKTWLVKPLDLRWKNRLRALSNAELDTFCLNEGGWGSPSRDWYDSVRRLLAQKFPLPAPWEV